MSDQDVDKDQKTEEATGRKLDQARSKGNVAYSREVSAALLLLFVTGVLALYGGDVVRPIESALKHALTLEGFSDVGREGISATFGRVFGPAFAPTGALLIAAAAAVLLAGLGQVGVSFSPERIEVRPERLDPLAGLSKLFNTQALYTLGKELLKVTIVLWLAYGAVGTVAEQLAFAPVASVGEAARAAFAGALSLGLRVGLFIAAIAVVDLFWTRFRHSRDLRMTKQEVKDERKQDEGSELVKAEVKRRMRLLGRQKMISDVKDAAVVIRNPTHFAVALRYDRKKDAAPRVVARGADKLALRIIAEAEKHGVAVVSKPELARELYKTVKLGATIPPLLFKAAAAVLAYVARRRKRAS